MTCQSMPFTSPPLFGKDSWSKNCRWFSCMWKFLHAKVPKWPLAKRCSLLRSNSSPKLEAIPAYQNRESKTEQHDHQDHRSSFPIFPLPLSLEPISSSDLALVWLSFFNIFNFNTPSNIDPLRSSNLHPQQRLFFSSCWGRFPNILSLNPFHSKLRLVERSMYRIWCLGPTFGNCGINGIVFIYMLHQISTFNIYRYIIYKQVASFAIWLALGQCHKRATIQLCQTQNLSISDCQSVTRWRWQPQNGL